MAEAIKSEKKKMPKGGAKGGTRFPQIDLQKALEYGKKLVSKTHNGPQPEQTIWVGVFNTKTSRAGTRASALKQYGLMEGDASEGYVASQLARDIEGAVPEERRNLVQRAFLTPKLFKQIYDTLQPDTVSRARVRQVVITAKVHPDSADKCVACFIDGAIYAGLADVLVNLAVDSSSDPDKLEKQLKLLKQYGLLR